MSEPKDNWHFVCLRRNGERTSVFIDNVELVNVANSYFPNDIYTLSLWADMSKTMANSARIDSVAGFDTSLSDNELEALYNRNELYGVRNDMEWNGEKYTKNMLPKAVFRPEEMLEI